MEQSRSHAGQTLVRQRSRASRAGLQTRLPGAPYPANDMAEIEIDIARRLSETPRRSRKSGVTFLADASPRGSVPAVPRTSVIDPRRSSSGNRKSLVDSHGEHRQSLAGTRRSMIDVQPPLLPSWAPDAAARQDPSIWNSSAESLDAANYPSTMHYEAAKRQAQARQYAELNTEKTKTEQRTGSQRGLVAKAQEMIHAEIAESEERMWAWWEQENAESKELLHSTADRVTALHHSCQAMQRVIESLAANAEAPLGRLATDVDESLKALSGGLSSDRSLLDSLRKDFDALSSEVRTLANKQVKSETEQRKKSITPQYDELHMKALHDALRTDFESFSQEMRSISRPQIDESRINAMIEKERLSREADLASLKLYVDQLSAHPGAKEQDIALMNELFEQRRAHEASMTSLRVDIESLGKKAEKWFQSAARVESVEGLSKAMLQERESRDAQMATLREDIERLVTEEMGPQVAKQLDITRMYELVEQERRGRDAAIASLRVDVESARLEAQQYSQSSVDIEQILQESRTHQDAASTAKRKSRTQYENDSGNLPSRESYLLARCQAELARVGGSLEHERRAREAAIASIRADVDTLSLKAQFLDGAYVDARYVNGVLQEERKAREVAFDMLRDDVVRLSAKYVNGVVQEERQAREKALEYVKTDIETLSAMERRVPAATELVTVRMNELLEHERRAREASLVSLRLELEGTGIKHSSARLNGLDDAWIKTLVEDEKIQRNVLCDDLRKDVDRLSSEIKRRAFSKDVQEVHGVVKRLLEETKVEHDRIKECLEPERIARTALSLELHNHLDSLRAEIKCLPKGSTVTEFSIPVLGEMQKLLESYRRDLNTVMNQLDQQGNQTSLLHNQFMQLRFEIASSAAAGPYRQPPTPRSTSRSNEISPVKLDKLLLPGTPDKGSGVDSDLRAMMAKSANELRQKTHENMKRLAGTSDEFLNDLALSRSSPRGGSPFLPASDAISIQSRSGQNAPNIDDIRSGQNAPNIDDIHIISDFLTDGTIDRDLKMTPDTKPGSILRRATDITDMGLTGASGYPSMGTTGARSRESSRRGSRESARRDQTPSASEISAFANEDHCEV